MRRKNRFSVQKLMCIIVSVLLLPGLSACAAEIGDIDLDDSITASDALQVLRYSVGLDEFTPEQKELADVDSDGDITAADALEILRYSVGLDAADSIGQPVESVNTEKDDVSEWADSLEIPKADTSAYQNIQTETENDATMTISAAEKDFCVTLENTETVTALKKLLPLTLDMSELNGNEKYCYLDTKLPSDPQKVNSIKAGDVMLYGDSCLVVFYKSFDTSYSYTKIGHIDDTSGLVQSLGSSSVTVTLRAKNASNGKFDIDSRTVLLNSGYEMPILGLGTWTQDDDTAENSVYTALKDGYRLIDTAQYYGNETGVGKGLKRAISEGIVSREEVFITTKVMPSNYDRAYRSIDDSLEKLDVDYIDLMLIHQSGSGDTEVYKALCQGVKDGKLRSIGISNYYTPEEYDRVVSGGDIKPAVVQNENHPFYQNTEFQKYVSQYGTVVESWYPFGGRGHTQDLFGNETIAAIAAAHGKTSAQIILRWHLQAGYVTIPGSQNPDHILENISVFDFELTDEEMRRMADLNTGNRYENW